MGFDLESRIRARAYGLWVEEGCPEGQALAHWVRAEQELAAEEPSASAKAGGLAEPAAPAYETGEKSRGSAKKGG